MVKSDMSETPFQNSVWLYQLSHDATLGSALSHTWTMGQESPVPVPNDLAKISVVVQDSCPSPCPYYYYYYYYLALSHACSDYTSLGCLVPWSRVLSLSQSCLVPRDLSCPTMATLSRSHVSPYPCEPSCDSCQSSNPRPRQLEVLH